MLSTCAQDVVVNCHESGAIAKQGDFDYPWLPRCDGPMMIPLGTVELLINTFDIDRECARGEVPMLDPN